MAEDRPLEAVIDDLRSAASGGEDVTVRDLIAAFEDRSVGALLTLLGLLLLIPVVGALPGAPFAFALLILAAIGQSFFQGGGLWVPGFLGDRAIGTDRLTGALDRAEPWARRIDGLTVERLSPIVASRQARLGILACVAILALSLLGLGLVPAGIVPAALGILVFGLALMSRDGLLALIGYGFTAAAIWLAIRLI